jgi:nucleoside-diphosphate-sugar epimerase
MKLDRIAITGGAGWLGGYIAAEVERHASVTLLDLAPDDGRPSLDVLDLDAVMTALEGHDGIIHLAGIASGVDASAKTFFEVNAQGTWNVLYAAHGAGICRADIASSFAAIGIEHDNLAHPPRYLPVDGAHPQSPIGPYGLSKAVNEETARSFARRGVTTIACLRPTLVTLPEEIGTLDNQAKLNDDDPAGDPNAYPGVLEWPLPILRSYVTPEDVARGFRLSLEADMAPCEIFNIAAADTIGPARSLAHAARIFGTPPEVRKPDRYEQDPGAGLIDIAYAREILGWEPKGRWPDVVARHAS